MHRNINVSTDVFAAIWSKRGDNENSEDEILRRLLGCGVSVRPGQAETETVEGEGVFDARNKVAFPEGFRIFRNYKGQKFSALAQGGAWVREDNNQRYSTLNQLNSSIAAGAENVWNGNWKFYDTDGSAKSIDLLRT